MPSFIDADLEITSLEDPRLIREGLGEAVVEMGCVRHDDGTWFTSFEIRGDTSREDPDSLIRRFCELVESLPGESRSMWDRALRRVVDLGYQSDDGAIVVRSSIRGETLVWLSGLGVELAVTVYPLIGRLGP